MAGRDDIHHDPVVRAALARDGATLEWIASSRSTGSGHAVEDAHHRGSCVIDARVHRDDAAAWFATVHFGDAISYHAQRGRRSITLRAGIPHTIADGLAGRTADTIDDAPGFDRLLIEDVRLSPGVPAAIIITPIAAQGEEE